MSDKSSKGQKNMDPASIIQETAAPFVASESVKARILRAARRLGWSYGRTRHAWYGTAKLSSDEIEKARFVALKNTRNLEALRDEYKRGLAIVAGAAERFAAVDPDFYSQEIDALRNLLAGSPPEDLP